MGRHRLWSEVMKAQSPTAGLCLESCGNSRKSISLDQNRSNRSCSRGARNPQVVGYHKDFYFDEDHRSPKGSEQRSHQTQCRCWQCHSADVWGIGWGGQRWIQGHWLGALQQSMGKTGGQDQLAVMEAVKTEKILGYSLKDSWLDLLTGLDGECGRWEREQWQLWSEMGRSTGGAGMVGKRKIWLGVYQVSSV